MRVVEDDKTKSPLIKWWIDISVKFMSSTERNRVALLLKLPPRDLVLTTHLSESRPSRVRLGKDNEGNESLSFFIQSLFVKNVPYVHSHSTLARFLGTLPSNSVQIVIHTHRPR